MPTNAKQKSIIAYESIERIKRYDADMNLCHPNRDKMLEIAINFLKTTGITDSPVVLDLGIGTGCFSWALLKSFPKAKIIGVDGSQTMLDTAKTRLEPLKGNIEFRQGDFRNISEILAKEKIIDAAVTSFSLHHLNPKDKTEVLKTIRQHLRPNSWCFNADAIVGDTLVEELWQNMRVAGIVKRAKGTDPRFMDIASARKWLDEMSANEKDQPITLPEELDIFTHAGFSHVSVLWAECREMVICGRSS